MTVDAQFMRRRAEGKNLPNLFLLEMAEILSKIWNTLFRVRVRDRGYLPPSIMI